MAKITERKAVTPGARILIERVQTGVRLEKRLLKVLKGLAEYHDMTLGDLLEGIVLHAFDGRHPFSAETRQRIEPRGAQRRQQGGGGGHREQDRDRRGKADRIARRYD